MTRHTRAKDLRRRVAVRAPKRTFVIFCEGETEVDYLTGLKRLPEIRENTNISIEISRHHGVPLTLVCRAIERRTRDQSPADEYWCVYDVEWPRHHPGLDRAAREAAGGGISLAVSNPCFELWLVLHHRDQTTFVDTATIESQSRSLDGRTGKRIDASIYLPLRALAAERALCAKRRHAGDGTAFPHDNPSSSMYLLLHAIEHGDPAPS